MRRAALLITVFALGCGSPLDDVEKNLNGTDDALRRAAFESLLRDLSSDKLSGAEKTRAIRLVDLALGRFLNDQPVETLKLLADHKYAGAAEAVKIRLRDPDHAVHRGAIRYFQAVPNMTAYGHLGRLVFDPDCGSDAQAAIRNLYNSGLMSFMAPGSGGAGMDIGALGDAVNKHNKQIEDVMGNLPDKKSPPRDKVEFAVAGLRSSVSDERLRACIELGMHGDPRARGPLLSACQDADDDVARAAGVALSKCGAGHHRDALVQLLADRRPAVRMAAALALEGMTSAREALEKRLGVEPEPAVKDLLRKALGN